MSLLSETFILQHAYLVLNIIKSLKNLTWTFHYLQIYLNNNLREANLISYSRRNVKLVRKYKSFYIATLSNKCDCTMIYRYYIHIYRLSMFRETPFKYKQIN